jgi:hypothetical protein
VVPYSRDFSPNSLGPLEPVNRPAYSRFNEKSVFAIVACGGVKGKSEGEI